MHEDVEDYLARPADRVDTGSALAYLVLAGELTQLGDNPAPLVTEPTVRVSTTYRRHPGGRAHGYQCWGHDT